MECVCVAMGVLQRLIIVGLCAYEHFGEDSMNLYRNLETEML